MFCEKCGAELLSDAAFCEDCGTPVETAATPPVPAQISTTYSQPPPLQKKSGSKTGVIIIMLVLLAGAAVAVLWFTGIIGGGNPDGEVPDTSPAQTTQTSEKSESQAAQKDPSSSAKPDNEDSPGVNSESGQFSTTETPTAGDFAWFTDKAVSWVYGTTPADASMPDDFYSLLGSWKGLQMIFDYDGTVLGYGYFTATFEESGPNVAATLDWHYIDWADGSHEELKDQADESMNGSFAAPTLTLGEAGNRIELLLYTMDGKQYAEGIWTVQSGEEVRVALVRP